MAIVTSIIVEDMPQRDGRRFIRERHTDQFGVIQEVAYLTDAADNVTTMMSARATQISQQLIDKELAANTLLAMGEGTFQPPTFKYCTALQLRNVLRPIYLAVKAFPACRLAWYIQQLGLTDNQLKAMFVTDDAGLPAVKAKLSSLESKYNDVQLQVGG